MGYLLENGLNSVKDLLQENDLNPCFPLNLSNSGPLYRNGLNSIKDLLLGNGLNPF